MATINPRKDQDENVIGWQAIIRKRGFPRTQDLADAETLSSSDDGIYLGQTG